MAKLSFLPRGGPSSRLAPIGTGDYLEQKPRRSTMTRLTLGCAVLLAMHASAAAEIVQTVSFENVPSVSVADDPGNSLQFFDVSVSEPFTLGAISWTGLATPVEDPDAGPDDLPFPTWGTDLRARFTHLASGNAAEAILGYGDLFGPDATPFAGTAMGLNGTDVQPGDSFSVEFFEQVDDETVSPDAIWDSISLNLDDGRAGPDMVRFDTTGSRTWRTIEGEPGAGFYGIQYGGGGGGPSITNVRLEGHDFSTFWFDLRIDVHGIGEDGHFRANVLEGVSHPTVTFLDEDPTRHPETGELLFADTFGSLELAFAPGDFGPGDLIRFGVLTATADHERYTTGDQMADLNFGGPLSITLTFEDGTKVTAPLEQVHPDRPLSGYVDLLLDDRASPSGGDTDGDGDVDGNDLLNSLLGFGQRSGALPADGDADGQGDVDRDDLTLVIANLGSNPGVPAAGSLATNGAVPEPSGGVLWLLGLGFATWIVRARRR